MAWLMITVRNESPDESQMSQVTQEVKYISFLNPQKHQCPPADEP